VKDFKLQPNYFIIPLLVLLVSALGSYFTSQGMMSGFYDSLDLPALAPPGAVIGAVWTVIYILTAAAILIVWNRFKRDDTFNRIIWLFVINGVLNVMWSCIFFTREFIRLAIVDAAAMGITVLILISLIYPRSKWTSMLLLPYLVWVIFATYLNYLIWIYN